MYRFYPVRAARLLLAAIVLYAFRVGWPLLPVGDSAGTMMTFARATSWINVVLTCYVWLTLRQLLIERFSFRYASLPIILYVCIDIALLVVGEMKWFDAYRPLNILLLLMAALVSILILLLLKGNLFGLKFLFSFITLMMCGSFLISYTPWGDELIQRQVDSWRINFPAIAFSGLHLL
ncbi:MAG: hypothetical protein EAZ89_01750, partial [Bacteroidetes bacterium]